MNRQNLEHVIPLLWTRVNYTHQMPELEQTRFTSLSISQGSLHSPYVLAQSCPTLCNPVDCSRQAPLSMGFSRQDNWNGLPSPPPGDLPDPGIEPGSLALAGGFFTLWATREARRNQSAASLISSWLLVFPWKAPPLYITCLFSFSVPTHTIKFCLKSLSKPVLKSRRSQQQFPGALGISQMLSEWLRQEKLPRLSVQRHCLIFCVHSSVSHLKHSPSVFKRNFQ